MRIQCPGCRQRFNTTKSFMGKTVECGSCNRQFKVERNTLVKEKVKVYLGEKNEVDRPEFKTAANTSDMTEVSSQQEYREGFNVRPLTPKRVLSILMGSAIFLFVTAFFLVERNGALKDVVTLSRYVLVGFAALVVGALLIYGMVKKRGVGIFLAFIFGAILLSLPYFLPGKRVIESSKAYANKEVVIEGEDSILINDRDIERNYLMDVGYGPVEKALEKHPKSEVVGILFRGANQLLGDKISDSLYESTNKLDRGIVYGRGKNILLLLTKQTMTIQDLKELCEEFGEVTKISEDLRLIDIDVKEKMVTSSSSAAHDTENSEFYEQNLISLGSIDQVERLGAIKRLGSVDPLAYRADVVSKLIDLLPSGDVEEQLAIVNTLKTWSKSGEGAELAVLLAAQDIYKKGELDAVTMEFLIERDVDGGVPILMGLWGDDPVSWSEMVIKLGSEAEGLILPKVAMLEGIKFTSACRILKKVGTAKSLTVLTSVLDTKDGQNQKTLKATIDEIKKRL